MIGEETTVKSNRVGPGTDDIFKDVIPAKTENPKDYRGDKKQFPVRIPISLSERARNIVYYERGITLTSLTEEALQTKICEMEKQHGGKYPQRGSEIPTGRPVKV